MSNSIKVAACFASDEVYPFARYRLNSQGKAVQKTRPSGYVVEKLTKLEGFCKNAGMQITKKHKNGFDFFDMNPKVFKSADLISGFTKKIHKCGKASTIETSTKEVNAFLDVSQGTVR